MKKPKESVKRIIATLQNRDIHERLPIRRFVKARGGARRRGINWELTYEQYRAIVDLPCAYCHERKFEAGCGLDRLDSAMHYTSDNVAPCCYICNQMKGLFPADLFRRHAKRVK